jgi:hypothetical protein
MISIMKRLMNQNTQIVPTAVPFLAMRAASASAS